MDISKIKIQDLKSARTYGQKVNLLIRTKYSIDEEFAILRQKETKPEEFAEYNKFCEECKIFVKNGGLKWKTFMK